MAKNREEARIRRIRFVRKSYRNLTAPLAIMFLTYSTKVHPSYGMTWSKRVRLGFRFWRNHSNVRSGTSWRAHLVIAMRLLETPPEVEGSVVECGCWKGGATVNLSIAADITGRKLKVYDSFKGLPPPSQGDPVAEHSFRNGFKAGVFGGTLEEVSANVRQYGAIEACEFYPGWFEDSLPHHEGDIVLAFWDVDFYSSLHDCLINLWPSVVDGGFVFLDEYRNIPYCAVFYSEKYWDKYFSTVPPGLVGIGTGIQVGMIYPDHRVPIMGPTGRTRVMSPESIGYCIKGTRAIWEYYPDEIEAANKKDPPVDPAVDHQPTKLV
ncbi:MAG: class I SAM-dependent methyltransferase [Halioglobus sp.]|nr:class I SAM-dependent methyltransferase [Halioglobus sp.]